MKTKLFGLVLMLLGLSSLAYTAFLILMTKGMLALIYGVIPFVAGWIIFNSACKESPKETDTSSEELKTGFARLRAFLKGLL